MFVQIFASSACTGVVCTTGAPKMPNSSPTTSPERAPTPPTMQGSGSISARKRPGATVERSVSECPGSSTPSRSSSAERMSRMSISMCEKDGVPRVITMWRARAAWARRAGGPSRPEACPRASSSSPSVSWNGMRPSRPAPRRGGSLSIPTTSRPRSANDSASGSPTRPRPTTATSAVLCEGVIQAKGSGAPARRPRSAAAASGAVAQILAEEGGHEARVVAHVARPQPPRLAREPVDPLQARSLHPVRRLGDEAGMEVERGAHPHEQGGAQAGAHRVHPALLLGLAGPHPHDRGSRAVDLRDHALLLLRRELAEGRREAPHDGQARETLEQAPAHELQRLLGATAIEVDRDLLTRRARTEVRHQVGAVDARGAWVPERAQRPHERLPVGHRERGAEHRVGHAGVLARGHHQVDRRRRHVSAPRRGDHGHHPVDHLLVVGDGQGDPQDLHAEGRSGRGGARGGGGGLRGDCVKIPAPVPIDPDFWMRRRVLVTGHTGFKGSWLCLWLQSLGARVTGLSPGVPTRPSLYDLAEVGTHMRELAVDVRDAVAMREGGSLADPEVIVHLAAQPMVRRSLRDPVLTYEVNVMGTVNLLEAVRAAGGERAAVVVTSDKCYENRGEASRTFVEDDPLGGEDPYSSSKACAELVTAAYRRSFFHAPGSEIGRAHV